MKNKFLSVLFAISLFFFIITFAIGLPIYVRPFYYAHIDAMDLVERSGFSKQEIVEAYDEVLNYLTLPWCEFGTGVMKYSEEGASHFADCKFLFLLNASVLLISFAAVAVLLVLKLLKKIQLPPLAKRSPAFWSAFSAIVLPLILGGLIALDFDRAFTIFHTIFFPGKDNWMFDYRTDQIIRVLPQDFFMNCAILIGAGVVVLSAAILIAELVISLKKRSSCDSEVPCDK